MFTTDTTQHSYKAIPMGLQKNIKSPNEMWQHFCGYVAFCNANPVKKHTFVGKDGRSDFEMIPRPLTYEGFCNYLQREDIIMNPIHYFQNFEGRYEDFIQVCSRIKMEIRDHQIVGGMAGLYNPSITQRLNGLTDKQEVSSNNNNINKIVIEEVQRKAIEGPGSNTEQS